MLDVNIAFAFVAFIFFATVLTALGFVYGYVVTRRVMQKQFYDQGFMIPTECHDCKFHDSCYIEVQLNQVNGYKGKLFCCVGVQKQKDHLSPNKKRENADHESK